MASLPVYDINGKEVGKYEVDPDSIAAKNQQAIAA